MIRLRIVLAGLLFCSAIQSREIPLDDVSRLDLRNAGAHLTTYRGKQSLALIAKDVSSDTLAIVRGTKFHNGTIEVDVSGAPAKNAPAAARGFIGMAFRAKSEPARYEAFYIRPTDGRADDQLRRNHSTQYISFPDWPWERLRKESPGLYESYTDLVPGEWTHLRIVVDGVNASLYVGASDQPALLVHDLKLGDREGSIALWSGPGTEAYFRNLRVTTPDEKPLH